MDPHVGANHGAGADNDVEPNRTVTYQQAYREYLKLRSTTGLDITTDGATGFFHGWMAALRHTEEQTVGYLTKSVKSVTVESEDGASRP